MTRDLEVADLARLLSQPEDSNLRVLYREALAPRAKLVDPLLSIAARHGATIGRIGEARLEMTRSRLETYRRIAGELCDRADVVALKGLAIADRYADGVLRGCVDLDLYAESVGDVWTVVRHALNNHPVETTDVSVLPHPEWDRVDVFVGMSWPSPWSELDSIYRVEVSTLPFLGNGKTVPPRFGLPCDGVGLHLLLVAEELFQRGVGARDLLDVHMLCHLLTMDDVPPITDVANRFRLAPELVTLLKSADAVELGSTDLFLWWIAELAGAARAELARRESGDDGSSGPPLAYGLLLDPGETADEGVIVDVAAERVLICPAGAYLLVHELDVDQHRYDRTVRSLAKVPAGAGRALEASVLRSPPGVG